MCPIVRQVMPWNPTEHRMNPQAGIRDQSLARILLSNIPHCSMAPAHAQEKCGIAQNQQTARSRRALECQMLTALVLICSVAVTPDLGSCDRDNAVHVLRVPAEFGSP